MTAFSIDGMFSDHMVLRHSRLNPVWGTAEPGRKVTVRLPGAERTCVTDGKGSSLRRPPEPSHRWRFSAGKNESCWTTWPAARSGWQGDNPIWNSR